MSTDAHVGETAEGTAAPSAFEHGDKHEGHSDFQYVKVAVVLGVLTALEVAAAETGWLGPAFIPIMLLLMAIKFWLVVQFFMHLRFDAKIFGFLFWSGFVLAVAVYVATLATMQVFNQS
jgi:cytochrome c oxidase subunit 4